MKQLTLQKKFNVMEHWTLCVCVWVLISGCRFSTGVDFCCLSLFVPADIIYSIIPAGLQSEAQREAAPRRTWLLLLCPAPGRHQASPSHFNYGWHCLKTCREKATHRFYWEAHTHYLKGFTAQKLFPVEAGIYLRWRGDALLTHIHAASGGKISNTDEALNTSLAWDEALHFPMLLLPTEFDPDVSSKYLSKVYRKL